MMRSVVRYAAIWAALMLFAIPLSAQDSEETVMLDTAGQFSVMLPDGVEIQPAADHTDIFGDLGGLDGNVIVIGETLVLVMSQDDLRPLIDIPADDTLDAEAYFELVDDAFRGLYNVYPDEVEFLEQTIGGFDAFTMRYFGQANGLDYEAETSLVVTDVATGEAFFVDAAAPEGELDAARADLDAIFASLTQVEDSTDTGSGEACIVSTDQARTATVRVGPGENRTAITFLNADQDYTVEGRFVADNGAVWYRLVKTEVDPGTSAAELWTAADGLTETGGCDTVGEAVAPPLRPIIEARPTSAPGSNNSGGGDTTEAPSGGVAPASGRWVLSYAARGTASCAGGGGIDFAREDLGFPASETLSISTAADGNSFLFDSSFEFVRINETAFLGDVTGAGLNLQVYFFPESTTRMRAEVRFNFVLQGFSCSATIPASANKQ